MAVISPEDLDEAIRRRLNGYAEEVTKGIQKAVKTAVKETGREIKRRIPFRQRTGNYLRAFRTMASVKGRSAYGRWYVKAPMHGLAHLLEDGHKTASGGRTKAYPHIRYGEELAKRRMEELAKEVIENAGK